MTQPLPVLEVEEGYNRGARFGVPEGTAYVGRGEASTIRLVADGVSRRHARLSCRPGEPVRVEDLESRNGTFVNGVRCRQPVTVAPGDRLRFGDVTLLLLEGEPGDEAPGSTVELAAGRGPGPERPERPRDRRSGRGVSRPPVELCGESPAMERLLEQVERVAGADRPVLLRGETGTGKELVARSIHALSPRRREPFVTVNCATLDGSLVESELFGHEKGAFTGAAARKQGLFEVAGEGVLFLDEVGELPSGAQAKLLRVLEGGDFRRVGGVEPLLARCRVLAATNRPLEDMVSDGRFREDLLYRLGVVELRVPPLRERGGDLELLIDRFLEQLNREVGRRLALESSARAALIAWRWPGNVRELKNALERAVILAPGPQVRLEDLPDTLRGERPSTPASEPEGGDSLPSLAEAERSLIERALERAGGKRAEAAALLGIDRKTLYRKIKSYSPAERS